MKMQTEISRIVVMGLVDRATEMNHYGAPQTAMHMLEMAQDIVQALNNLKQYDTNKAHSEWKARLDMGLDNIRENQ